MAKKVTPRYHRIGNASNVDESLFGGSEKKKFGDSSRRVVTGPIDDPHAVIVTESDLYRLKQCSTIKTEQQERLEREAALKIKEEREKKARERKLRMIELEEIARRNAKKSDAELMKEARDNAIRDMAEEKLVNESDLVKLLSTLGARAAAFTIRDRQLEEKHHREEEEAEYNRRLDMMMEIDRLKDLQRREDEDNYKRSKRHEDRKVITEQIQERQRQKLLSAEAREQENQAMRNMKLKFDEEDRVAAEKRQVLIERSRLEVLKANEDAIRRKKALKDGEKAEVEEILRYQAMRDAEMAKREEEEERAAQLKKEAQLKMLASQERSNNKQAEIDELRARRAAEEKERRYRAQERENAERRKSDLLELNRVRHQQAEDRRQRTKAEKSMDLVEYSAAMAYTQKMIDREETEKRAKDEGNARHREMLQKQIEDNELQKRRNRTNTFDQGAANRQKFISDKTRLETIREKMVRDLEDQGVNPRYLTEMKNVNIEKIMNR